MAKIQKSASKLEFVYVLNLGLEELGRDHKTSTSANSPLESIWTTPCRPVQESKMEQILTGMKTYESQINV